MDISGLIQSYDSRATSSAALTRTVMAPQYVQHHPYPRTTTNSIMPSNQQILHNPFSFSTYSGGTPNILVPTFASDYIQQRPLPRLMHPIPDGRRSLSFSRNNRQGFVEELQTHSPPIKLEPQWNSPVSPTFGQTKSQTVTSPTSNGSFDVNFGTEVDTLMKAIQAKSQTVPPQTSSPVDQSKPVVGGPFTPPYAQPISQIARETVEESKFKLTPGDDQDITASPKGDKKRYRCTIEKCSKSFCQKTHLDIHVRAHTGDKPYPCRQPGCDRSFSQLGNLKTHERRHTGERPYPCEICGKRFAQRGNVRAHKIVHDQSKPYLCRLDDCGKQFTQLGNLKSHQNKFHIATIRDLTSKFASIKDGDIVNAADKELWEYFADLYKNSNKGIKGRGKDRKVGHNSLALNRSVPNMGMSQREYGMGGAGRGNMVVGVIGMKGAGAGQGETHYEVFDADDESQAGSHSGGGSSVETGYDDAPSDGFEDGGRTGELAFGDRIY